MNGQGQSVHKRFAPEYKETLVPQVKWKYALSPRLHPQFDHIHTHTQSKWKFYVLICLGPFQFQSTGQNTHLISKQQFDFIGLQEKLNTPNSNQPKLSPVSESSTHSLQNYVCFFALTSRPRNHVLLSVPLEWSQVTHIPASIKSTSPKSKVFYSTHARQLCDDTCLPGWVAAFPAHSKYSSPLKQSLHT